VAERTEGKSPVDTIYEDCLIRFRPVMMTTMAALMGTLAIALDFGAGAQSRRPLGLALVGGLMVSQLITLLHHACLLHRPGFLPKLVACFLW
jgi:HAE1 family hydrophobic/amphiphilic exporter-1